jgi:hypothetical protein
VFGCNENVREKYGKGKQDTIFLFNRVGVEIFLFGICLKATA